MTIEPYLLKTMLYAMLSALLISFVATPFVKKFAEKIGAMDIPKDERRVHDHPIPRLGGLAIFLGLLISVLLFVKISQQIRGILIGAVVIVIIGVIDDIIRLPALVKLVGQIVAACIAVGYGVVIHVLSNPVFFITKSNLFLGIMSIPITVFWIVAITNSVNLIDGLDGLAVGVSTIATITMLIVALIVPRDENVAVILAALLGACIGFMPYNLNPAKIFMGDTGALLLGYILSTVSIIGFFKFYAIISFFVPLIALALPISDTVFAFFRRLLKGQNPMKPDRGHFHHKLLDLGLNQKQAVAVMYCISALLGVAAVVLTTGTGWRWLVLIIAIIILAIVAVLLVHGKHHAEQNILLEKMEKTKKKEEKVDMK